MANGFGMVLAQPVTAFQQGREARQQFEMREMERRAAEEEMARRNRLRELGGVAFSAPAAQRGEVLSQVAQVSPEAAFDWQQQFAKMDESQRAQTRAQAREQLEPLAREIAYISKLPPDQKQAAYETAVARFAQQGQDVSSFQGIPADQGLERVRAELSELDQVLGLGLGKGGVQSTVIGDDGFYYTIDRQTGQFVNSGVRASPSVKILEQEGQIPFGVVTGRGAPGAIVPIGGESQGAVLPEGTANAVIARMNEMIQSGVPEADVEEWAQQQLRGQPAQPVGPVRIPTAEERAAAEVRGKAMAEREANMPEKRRTATRALQRAETQLTTMSRLAEDLGRRANIFTTGLVGGVGSFIPGTPQHDMAKDIDTLKSIIGLRELQEIRDNSPTGGALGPVSDFENRLMQATIANLEQSQSPEQFRRNLKIVEKQAKESWERVRQAYEEDFSGGTSQGDIDALLRKYGVE